MTVFTKQGTNDLRKLAVIHHARCPFTIIVPESVFTLLNAVFCLPIYPDLRPINNSQ